MKVGIILPAFIVFIADRVFVISKYRLIYIHPCVVYSKYGKNQSRTKHTIKHHKQHIHKSENTHKVGNVPNTFQTHPLSPHQHKISDNYPNLSQNIFVQHIT